MNRMIRNSVVCAAYALGMIFAGGGVLPQPVLAQEATLEEVLVTAQRREESLQEVPLAITVLSGEDLERRQVHNILDLQSSVPNISISQNTGTPSAARIFLRGVGQDESRATVEPAIPLYIDGVYIGRQIGALVDLFDVERVEVLRGPQGTLYGRNANGGAVRIITRKPTYEETFLTLKNTIGNESRIDAQLSANLSNSPDLAVSFSLLTRTRDGLFQTTEPSDPNAASVGKQEVGEWDNFSGRVGVRWQAGDATEMLLRYDITADNTDPRPANSPFVDEDDIFDLQAATGSPAGVNTDAYNSEVDSRGLSLTVDHDLGDGLQLQSLTAWRSLEDDLATFISFPYSQQTEQSQVSQEIQVSSDWDDGFNFVAGVFWFDEDIDLDFTFIFNFDLEVETRAWAVFGQGTWDLSERLRVTAGVRYTDEEKDFKGEMSPFGFAREDTQEWENTSYKLAVNYQLQDNMMLYGSYSTGFKSGAWSPDAFGAAATFLPVDEETVKTAEVGIRSDLLNNQLRFNATYFFSKYEDLQLGGTTDLGFTQFNVPEAEISGLEIEANAALAPGLNVSLALAWLDAEYSDVDFSASLGISGRNFTNEVNAAITEEVDEQLALASGGSITEQQIVDQVLSTDMMNMNPTIPSTATFGWLETNEGAALGAAKLAVGRMQLGTTFVSDTEASVTADILNDAENNDLKNAPESSIKLAVSYTYPLADNLDLQLNAEYIYEDESFNLVANPEAVKRDETDLINLRVGVRSEQWEMFLWGKNLTDEIYYPAGTSGGVGQAVYVADPRTYGLDFKLYFGK